MFIDMLAETIIRMYTKNKNYNFHENAFRLEQLPNKGVYVLYDERICLPLSEALVAFSYHLYPEKRITSMKKNKDALFVHSSIQLKGIGTEIVSGMETISRLQGITRIVIEDARARDFWVKLGYSFFDFGLAVKEL
jgi:GNAT superfamily N-acetyltransferase